MTVPLPVREGEDSLSLKDESDDAEYEYNFEHLAKYLADSQNRGYKTQSETLVTFLDEDVSEGAGMTSSNRTFSTKDNTLGIDLGNWLNRPVRIKTITWNESDPTNLRDNITPWYDYLNNTQVKNKLNNYSWFRGNLKIRIQVTASPFYFGMMKVIYRPLLAIRGDTATPDGADKNLIQLSQLPHIDIIPGTNDAYEMTLPFIYHKNYVNLQVAADVQALGRLQYIIYSKLDSANGVTGTGVTVATYAWMEDVDLSGASTGYALQSDEYGEGPVSKPASWVAKAATYFEGIPVIGTFATATRIGAGAISSIARLFGFTNVPVIADTEPFRPEAFPKIASTEVGFPIEKLSMDPKSELSIDPRIVCGNGEDEMMINHFAKRESFLTTVNWITSDAADTLLFYSRINPQMYDIDAATNPRVFLTPMAYVARPFVDWRGSIIFRFQIIASKYHKGKLIISFDPSGSSTLNIGNTVNTSNVVYTSIVDIGETHDVEFEVPYQQATQFLSNRGTYVGNKNWAVRTAYPGTHIYDQNFDNGLLTVRVLNTLTAPVLTSDIDILVYVRAGNDIEFAQPSDLQDSTGVLSFYAPQSDEVSESSKSHEVIMAPTKGVPDEQYLVHYGENVRSIRTLLRRYNLLQTETQQTPAVGEYGDFYKYIYRMPVTPGYAALSTTLGNKIVGAGTAGYNFCFMTSLGWFSNCFLAYRGGTNWTFNPDFPIKISNFIATRQPYSNLPVTSNVGIAAIVNSNTMNQYAYNQRNAYYAGAALTNTNIQPGLNIYNPDYSRFKFHYCNAGNANQGSVTDASNQGFIAVKATFSPYTTNATRQYGSIATYVAAGVDYGLYFFLNTPDLYVYTTVVTYA